MAKEYWDDGKKKPEEKKERLVARRSKEERFGEGLATRWESGKSHVRWRQKWPWNLAFDFQLHFDPSYGSCLTLPYSLGCSVCVFLVFLWDGNPFHLPVTLARMRNPSTLCFPPLASGINSSFFSFPLWWLILIVAVPMALLPGLGHQPAAPWPMSPQWQWHSFLRFQFPWWYFQMYWFLLTCLLS